MIGKDIGFYLCKCTARQIRKLNRSFISNKRAVDEYVVRLRLFKNLDGTRCALVLVIIPIVPTAWLLSYQINDLHFTFKFSIGINNPSALSHHNHFIPIKSLNVIHDSMIGLQLGNFCRVYLLKIIQIRK